MADKNLWAAFEKTGKVTDYLQYKNLNRNEEEENRKLGESKFESDGNSNRHDTVRSTYRGI